MQLEREGNIRKENRDRVHEIAWKILGEKSERERKRLEVVAGGGSEA